MQSDYVMTKFHTRLANKLEQFLQDVVDKKSPRLIVEVPPQFGKSQQCAKHFPAYGMGKHPSMDWLVGTYGQDLADDHGVHIRDTILSAQYQDVFPGTTPNKSHKAKDWIKNEQHGQVFLTSTTGGATGFGCEVFVIDDPFKGRAEADSMSERNKVWGWYQAVAKSRVRHGGGIIVFHTRWHEDDLIGRLKEGMAEGGYQWDVLTFPAIAEEDEYFEGELWRKEGESLDPVNWPIEGLIEKREDYMITRSGAREWTALYQQRPVPADGIIFDTNDIYGCLYKVGEEPANLNYYAAGDLAISEEKHGHFSAMGVGGVDCHGTLWIHPKIFYKKEKDPNELVKRIIGYMRKFKPYGFTLERMQVALTIEPLINRAQRLARLPTKLYLETMGNKNKEERAYTLKGLIMDHAIRLPDTPFVREHLIPQLQGFPATKLDDLVDWLAWLAIGVDRYMGAVVPKVEEAEEIVEWSMEDIKRRVDSRKRINKDLGRVGTARVPKGLNGRYIL